MVSRLDSCHVSIIPAAAAADYPAGILPQPYPGSPSHYAPICPITGRSFGGRWTAAEIAALLRLAEALPPPIDPADFERLATLALRGVSCV